ncbi:MAG: glycosyltransferase [Porticoccaceae bacterium]|nr:glycosyltransferase [Porticoccaceae bacterium]
MTPQAQPITANLPANSAKVSLILLNWNGKDDTLACLKSVQDINYTNYDVVVVDNGSSDDSVNAIKQEFPDITLLETGANLGFAEGNNVGIRYALKQHPDFILLLNNDTVVETDFLDQLISYAASKGNKGLFGPKINYFDQPDTLWWAGSKWNAEALEFEHTGINQRDSGAYDQAREIDYVCGCALLIPTKIINEIGLMDPQYFLTYEETDWCYRAREAGYASYYVPQSRIYHKVSASFGGNNSPLQHYFYTRNKLRWARRHLSFWVFFRLLRQMTLRIGGWDHNKPYSPRQLRWNFANARKKLSRHNADPVQAAKAMGLRDYLFHRFGDCPEHVRALGKNDTINPASKELCVGFVPWWPQNPYQVLLRDQLRQQGFRIIGNPPLNLLKILFKRDGLDIVHLHWPHDLYFKNYLRYPLAIFTLLMFRLLKNNIVWTVHELKFYETRHPRLDTFFVKFLMKISKTLIVHSQYSENEIRETFNFPRPIFKVKHPNYIDVYDNDSSQTEARKKLGVDLDTKVFLFLGYIKPYKGVEDLIQAFRGLEGDNLRLLIAGTPLNEAIAQDLKQLAAGDARIHLNLVYVPDDDIQLYLNAADLVVFPFRQTHTSGSVLLAASFGKPVLVPNTASIPEYIDESMGFFFEPDENESLHEALALALEADLSCMGKQAYDKISDYTWQDMATVHAQAYRLATLK